MEAGRSMDEHPYPALRRLVPDPDAPHGFSKSVEPERVHLPTGSAQARIAALQGAGIQTPLLTGSTQRERAWTTQTMGSGITLEMSGFRCHSAWAWEQSLKSVVLALR